MKKTLAAVTAAALIGVSGAANAADFYLPASAKDRPAYVPPPIWTGFYIGAHVGGIWANINNRDLNNWLGDGLGWGWSNNNSGVFGGGTVGYNYQVRGWGFGSGSAVIGFEADFGGAGLTGSWNNGHVGLVNYFWEKNDGNFYADFTGRLGYAFGPTLIYAKGGYAYFDANSSVGGLYLPLGVGAVLTPWSVGNSNKGLNGWTVGGGVEYAFSPNWSVKAEYLYFDFNRDTLHWLDPVNQLTYGFDHDLTVNSFKVGVNYRFGAFYTPLK